MARKRSKVLSTIRALGDKPEPTLTQRKQEDKGSVQPPLQPSLIPIAEESELRLQEPETPLESPSNELVASLLLTSVLEEQLSESATGTAEALHISEVSTSEITTPKVTESWPEEPELKESAIAKPALETVLEATAPEPEATIPQPEAEFPKAQVELEPDLELGSELEAEPELEAGPESKSELELEPEPQLSEAEPKLTASAPPCHDTRQAIATRSDVEELLKRPEALVLIVITFFWTIWQTYTNLWQRTPRKKN